MLWDRALSSKHAGVRKRSLVNEGVVQGRRSDACEAVRNVREVQLGKGACARRYQLKTLA